MKLLTTLIIASLFIGAANPPSKLQFDEIVIYDIKVHPGELVVNDKGQLAESLKEATLDKAVAKDLDTRLFQKSSYGDGVAACFDPHLGIVYYLDKKIVAHFTVCMDCNRLVGSVDIPAQLQGKVGKGEEAYYARQGMSKSFRKFLNGLLVKHKFSHQIE